MADGRMTLPVARGFGETARRDLWWVQPLIVVAVFGSFIVYSTWAALQNAHYQYQGYLSPFYSPLIYGEGSHAWFGDRPGWWPAWLLFSPALLILWAPGGFRFTCYYYRGAYYKAFWADPPNCAVGEPRKGYWGENSLPLILQNIHRYFMYLAVIFLVFLSIDVYKGLWFHTDPRDPRSPVHFGIGVGTLVLLLNVILLGGYTFGCHSLRHLIGGYRDNLTSAPGQKRVYDCVSCFNRWHGVWAWSSLFWVAFSDIYVRMLSMGYWTDVRIL